MSKQIYEEALADIRKVTDVAEDKAKRAILEAVIPRIRNLIDNELLNEDVGFDDEDDPFSTPRPGPVDHAAAGSISAPDENGKVTLDIDAMTDLDCDQEDPVAVRQPLFGKSLPEYELNTESLAILDSVVESGRVLNIVDVESNLLKIAEIAVRFKNASRLIKETKSYGQKIAKLIANVEDMYDYVQESLGDSRDKGRLEALLESNYRDLTKLQEQTKMSKKKLIDLLREEDDSQMGAMDDMDGDELDSEDGGGELTLKLTGLPDDVDLDGVGIDLITGDGDDDMDDMGDLETGDEAGLDDDGGDDVDLGGFGDDLEGDDEEEGTQQMEVSRLSNDTIVEIDENMLRREIRRMRRISEASSEKPGDANGYGIDANVLDDFGGASEECDAFLDGDVTTDGAEPLGEADDMPMDEMDDLDEEDELEMDELQNRRSADEAGEGATMHSASEGVSRRLAFESRLQRRSRRRGIALKKEARYSSSRSRRLALKNEYRKVVQRFNESVTRTKKFKRQLVEARRLKESRSNSGSKQKAENAVKMLRRKLSAETLLNAKLTYATRIVQNESLSKRQKTMIIEKLEEARTPQAAKLVYDKVTSSMRKSLKENQTRKVMGSSSRATSSGSSQTLNEGFETERWSRLAGITK